MYNVKSASWVKTSWSDLAKSQGSYKANVALKWTIMHLQPKWSFGLGILSGYTHAKCEGLLNTSADISKTSFEQGVSYIKTINNLGNNTLWRYLGQRQYHTKRYKFFLLTSNYIPHFSWSFYSYRLQWPSFPWWPWMILKWSSKVTWIILSTHIVHTLILDEPFQSCSTLYIWILCLIFNSPCKIPKPSKSERSTILSRPFSSVFIRAPLLGQILFKLHTKSYLSWPLHEIFYFLSSKTIV